MMRVGLVWVLGVAGVALISAVLLLPRTEPVACKPLVVFYGGFGSQTKENLLWEVCQEYSKPGVRKQCLAYSADGTDFIVDYWKSTPGETPIVLVGHSWGGDTAYTVAEQLPQNMAPTLITLDPVGGRAWTTVGIPNVLAVSVRKDDLAKPTHGEWVNIHQAARRVDFDGSLLELVKLAHCDGIADIGGLWGHQRNANSIEFAGGHCNIDRMFALAEIYIATATKCLHG